MAHLAYPLLGLVAAAQSNAASEPVWRWDKGVSICVLRQEISGTTVEISRTPANDSTGVTVSILSATKMAEADTVKGAIGLEPGGEIAADVFQQATPDEQHLQISAGTEDPDFLTKFGKASALVISGPGIRQVPVSLKAAAAAARALLSCEGQKMKEWEIDPLAWKALRAAPKPLQPLWKRISPEDYPRLALAYSVQGDAVIRLNVGQDGRVKGCKALNPTKYRGFEHTTCDLMWGAKFQPALNGSGVPVPAPYIFYIRFRIWPS